MSVDPLGGLRLLASNNFQWGCNIQEGADCIDRHMLMEADCIDMDVCFCVYHDALNGSFGTQVCTGVHRCMFTFVPEGHGHQSHPWQAVSMLSYNSYLSCVSQWLPWQPSGHCPDVPVACVT